MKSKVLEGFAGPGGLSESARMVGLADVLGIEWSADACATAEAAGHRRLRSDIRLLDPDDYEAEGWLSAPPCQTFNSAGKGTGRDDNQTMVDAIPAMGHSFTDARADRLREFQSFTADLVTDERTALVLETLEFAICLPKVRWLVAEQVPQVRGIWMEMAAELAAFHRFSYCAVVTLRADDFGAATRRSRVFFVATRGYTPDLSGLPLRGWWECSRFGGPPEERSPNRMSPFPLVSMAAALGWSAGVTVNTRGERKTAGGNEFSADRPALSLTGNGARTWYRTDLGSVDGRIESWQAGVLQGFPKDYPWRGTRTSQFQQAADSVPPLMGAAVIGAVTGQPWEEAIWQRLEGIYPVSRPSSSRYRLCADRTPSGQLDIFGEAA